MNVRLLIGIAMVLTGVFWNNIKNVIPEILDNNPVMVVEKPEDSLIDKWSEVSKSITDPKDKIYLCVFNKTFADRVIGYEATAQQVNDVYVLAAKRVFGDSLKGKYEKLAPATREAMISIIGEEDHSVIEPEKIDLNKIFLAFAWCLNN